MAGFGFFITARAFLPVLGGVICGGERMAFFGCCIFACAAFLPVLIAIISVSERVTTLRACGAANGTHLPMIARVRRIRRTIRMRAAYRKGPRFGDGVGIIFDCTVLVILVAYQLNRN